MIGESDFGWGDADAGASTAFSGVGSVALIVASGFYCAALWFASGLQPLPYLASRARLRHAATNQRAETPK
jgi:hypothetical protein